jgi:hypothetical protein
MIVGGYAPEIKASGPSTARYRCSRAEIVWVEAEALPLVIGELSSK